MLTRPRTGHHPWCDAMSTAPGQDPSLCGERLLTCDECGEPTCPACDEGICPACAEWDEHCRDCGMDISSSPHTHECNPTVSRVGRAA